jgi:hypothetical protein
MPDHYKSLSGRWVGKYSYAENDGDPCAFDATMVEISGGIQGEIIEPNNFILDAGNTLLSVFSGWRDGAAISFTKTYTDFYQGDNPVYEGEVNASLTQINGYWHFPLYPSQKGGFIMVRATRLATQAERRETSDLLIEL